MPSSTENRLVTARDVIRTWLQSLGMLLVIGWFDYVTGYELHVFAFYFLPVGLLGWRLGGRPAVVSALLAALVWIAADLASGHVYESRWVLFWNTAMEALACLTVALITARTKRAMVALRTANDDLSQALAQIKTLEGLLPICAGCKAIRSDNGDWEQMEKYITQHSAARFSHGLCPACATRLYPDYFPEPAKGGGTSSSGIP